MLLDTVKADDKFVEGLRGKQPMPGCAPVDVGVTPGEGLGYCPSLPSVFIFGYCTGLYAEPCPAALPEEGRESSIVW